jgi:predicted ABC-type ATPase
LPESRPFCLCIAGPNGSGKSTLTERLRKTIPLQYWIDPDVVAAQLRQSMGADAEDAAFREARNLRVKYAIELRDFGFETVYSHPSNLDFLHALKLAGYEVHLYFICTATPQINIARVANRVALGGHDVPRDKIVSRYRRSLQNLILSVAICDRIVLFDNSSVLGEGRVVGGIDRQPAGAFIGLRARPHVPAWAGRTVYSAFAPDGPATRETIREDPVLRSSQAERALHLNRFAFG